MKMSRPWLHRLSLVVALALVSIAYGGQGLLARADGAIQVLDNSHQVEFSQSVTFRLQVEADNEVAEVTLYFRREGEGVTVRVPVSISAGEERFSYTWQLEPGQVPVAERIEYDWRIVDSAGNELRTSPLTFEYADDRFDWQTVQQGNIILHWYRSSESEARRLLGYAAQSLARLQGEMGVTLQQPVHIHVYGNNSDMSLALPRRSEAYDDRILTLGVVVDDATLLLLGSHPDVEGTIAHELSHVVVGLATDNPYTDLPRWLDEGLAMFAEGELPAENRRALESAVRRDQLISVRSLSAYTGDPGYVDLFYGEAYSVVEFLLQAYGKGKMAHLLDSFTEGIAQEDALRRVYGFGVDGLDALWRESLGLQPRQAPGVATPTPERPQPRPGLPCPQALLGGFLSVAGVAAGRKRARAS
jgi:hypothetical protein